MYEHFLQSETWKSYEELEGKTVFVEKGEDYHFLAVLEKTKLGNYLSLPYGPSLSKENPKAAFKHALAALQKLAEAHSCFFLRLEPTFAFDASWLESEGLVKSKDIDPAHTWLLRLDDKSEDDLLKGMESRKVRYWRNCAKKNISLRTSKNPEEITILTNFLKTLGEKDSFTPQTESHLKNQLKSGFATLYVAELTDESNPIPVPIAAALIYDYEDTRYYMHAATDFEHRNLMAGTIILIQMILDAKADGKRFYDFWGITTSEDKNHPWYGFTQYKKSFGGFEVDYSGTWDFPLNKRKYSLYKKVRKANRLLRKISK